MDGTGVRITWEASTSPETSSYIIYRIEDNGTFPIDTVSGALTYLDDTADFTSQTESYFVVALDDCENNSIFGDAHNSIFLNASVDPCTQSITLNWNPYDDWMQGVDRQEIWLTDGTIPPSKIEELSPGLDTYTLNGIVDNQTYIINIRAVQADDEAVYSDSNPIVLRPDVIEPVRELTAYYLCTNMDNSISVFWNWNAGAELQEFSVCRTDQEDQVVVESITINLPTGEEEVFQDVNANGAEEIYTYDIKTIDLCDSMNISNKISNIVLTVDQVDNSSNQIVWTDFFMERGTLKFYDLFRTQNGQGVHLGTFGPGETEFLDVYDAEAFSDEVFFYYVTATAEVEQVDGTAVDASVKSNLARLEKVAYIIAPNAFVPTGKNNVFKPVLFNRNSLQVFEMKIWDRWGQLIFQSSDPNVGWDGRKDGRFLPKGVYAYVVEMTMKNGDETIDRGSVLLLK